MKKIFVVDVMAMAFRSYHAMARRPLANSKGFPTSAIFGSAMFLMKLIESEKPDFLVLVTDTKSPTFRHKLYPKYKQNRTQMPEDLALQIPVLFKMFETWNIPLLKEEGFEADDLIGSIATQWADDSHQCYLVSGDKDFMQLINENVFLYSPKKGGECLKIDVQGVQDTLKGCLPSQVIDVMALAGDVADNIPGIKGFGYATAGQLVKEFGSLDKIYENLDSIKSNNQRQKLINSKELAYLSKQLVIIKRDVKLKIDRDAAQLNLQGFLASKEILPFFEEMEFNLLASRIRTHLKTQSETVIETSEETSGPKEVSQRSCVHVNDKKTFNKFLSQLAQNNSWAFSVETTGKDKLNDSLVGISFSVQKDHGYYLDLKEDHPSLKVHEVIDGLKPFFNNSEQLKISYDLKFVIQMFAQVGIDIEPPYSDVMLLAFLLEPGKSTYPFLSIASQYLKSDGDFSRYEKTDSEDLAQNEMGLRISRSCHSSFGCEKLHEVLYQKLSPPVRSVYEDIELPLVPILANMELQGILLDVEVLNHISSTLDVESKKLQKEIFDLAGEKFNINSPKQLQYILYEKLKIHEELGIKRLKKTKTGFSTDVTVLELLSKHPLPAKILAYRTTTKLKNTYVDPLPQLVDQKTHRIHSNFHQTGTATGRLSSTHPNLQNIPIRSEAGKQIRKAFIAKSGNVLISADYSQIELRLLAHLTQDPGLLKAFESHEDIHTATAATVFKKDASEVDGLDRSKAKAINYGIIYGMGPNRLAKSTGVSVSEAKNFMKLYFDSFPNIAAFIDKTVLEAQEKGYSQTLVGRRRPIEGLDGSQGKLAQVNARNIAVNSPIQGSAADLIKKAMLNINLMLNKKGYKAKMLVQVHDELVFECPEHEKNDLIQMIRDEMNHAIKLKVAVETEIGSGSNWLEAH